MLIYALFCKVSPHELKALKFILKFFLIGIIVSMILIGSLLGYLYYNRAQIEKSVISRLNEYINTPVNVGAIELDLIQKFPNISLLFKDIEIKGSKTNEKSTLLIADQLLLTFNIIDLINENYNIEKVYLENAYITMLVDKDGNINYDVIKKRTSSPSVSQDEDVAFNLKSIHLQNVDFQYINFFKQQDYSLLIPQAIGSFKTENEVIAIDLSGDSHLKYIKIGDTKLLRDKELGIKTNLIIDTKNSFLEFGDSEIKVKETIFLTQGKVSFGDVPKIKMSVKTADSKVSTLLSLLPDNIYDGIKSYNSSGEAHFKATIDGEINTVKSPSLDISFGFNNLSLIHPTSKIKVKELNLKGLYTNKGNGNVNIERFTCFVNDRPVHGEFIYRNFKDPYIKAHFNTKQELSSWLALFEYTNCKTAIGSASVDFNIDGKLDDIKNKVVDRTHVRGQVTAFAENVVFANNKTLSNTHLKLRMDNHDLVVDTLTGNFEHSDFDIKGSFKSFIVFLLDKNAKLDLEASLNSSHININDFYTTSNQTPTKGENKNVTLPDNLYLNFKCQINDLIYNELDFKKFKGNLKIIPNHIEFENVNTQLAGGEIKLKGDISTLKQKNPRFDATIELRKIYIDTVMNLFNNFDQSFITADNLQGQLTTKVYINGSLDNNGQIDPTTVFSNIDITIANGRLINFAPMQKMAKFIDENELSDIKFSELKNSFHIENSIVYVPEMTIKSNLNTLSIMGSHKFTTAMDYKLKIDLKRKKRDADEKFGTIKVDESGRSQIFLTIKGTSDDMKIAYDKEAAKDKIQDRWKEEKKEMKNLFKKDPVKEDKKTLIDTDRELIDME